MYHRVLFPYHNCPCCLDLQRLYPINYVRNVALRNTHTAYSIFVDVDLVPNKKLYKYLKQYITNNPHDNVVGWLINADLYYQSGTSNQYRHSLHMF